MSENNKSKLILLLAGAALLTSFARPGFAAPKKSVTVRTEHDEAQKEVSGQITAVSVAKNLIVVNGQTFDLPPGTTLTINGAAGMLMHVKVGDQARVTYTIHIRTTIRSSGRSKSGSRSSKELNTGKTGTITADSVAVTQ